MAVLVFLFGTFANLCAILTVLFSEVTMIITQIWIASALRPDPNGHAVSAAIIDAPFLANPVQVTRYIGFGPGMSTNRAVYDAVLMAFKWLAAHKITEAVIWCDLMMVVEQLNGRWQAKRGAYLDVYGQAALEFGQLPNVAIKQIPLAENQAAHDLAKDALSAHMAGYLNGDQPTPFERGEVTVDEVMDKFAAYDLDPRERE